MRLLFAQGLTPAYLTTMNTIYYCFDFWLLFVQGLTLAYLKLGQPHLAAGCFG